MTQETRELIVRALRRAAHEWEIDADEATTKPGTAKNLAREAIFVRGFAEALENGCSL